MTNGGIVVSRPARSNWARFRKLRILIDGKEAGAVRYGESVRLPAAPGLHELRVKLGRSGSEPLDVEVVTEGRDLHVQVVPDAQWFRTPGLKKVFSSQGWLRLEQVS
jgi:hypothetical protein